MGHSCRESPDDEPEVSEPPRWFQKYAKEDLKCSNDDEIMGEWLILLDKEKTEAQESRADYLAQVRKDEQ